MVFIMLLANGLSACPMKGNPVFNNGPKSLPENGPDCAILCNLVFDDFILADKPFGQALRNFQTGVLINNNLCGKLFSALESPTTFEQFSKLLQYQILFHILIY